MALLDLKTDLSKIRSDSFTSDIENKSKGIASGLNLDFASLRPIQDKIKEGVPQPNLKFGGSLDKPTPTVPTSMPGTPEKPSVVPKSFDATPNKPTPSIPTSMPATPEKPVQSALTSMLPTPEKGTVVPRSYSTKLDHPAPPVPTSMLPTPEKSTTVPNSFNTTLEKPTPEIPSNWESFVDLATNPISTVTEKQIARLGLRHRWLASSGKTLGFVDNWPNTHATGFTGYRTFGDTIFPEGSEYIGIGSYNNPGELWRGKTPQGQVHEMWDSNFPTLDTHPHDEGVSNPYYSSKNKLFGALEGWTDTKGSYFQYFKRNQSGIDINARGTLKSAWNHGSVTLTFEQTGVNDIETNQYTKFAKTRLFNDSFTSFPNAEGQKHSIPAKLDSAPPSMLTFPRGGPVLAAKRSLTDIERHAKWILSSRGITWGLTQIGLQLLNTRPETRIWNPLSLGSIIPTMHIPRHFQKVNLGINANIFGETAGGTGDGTYSYAYDWIDGPTSLGPIYIGGYSRLTSLLKGYIDVDNKENISETIVNAQMQTPGQLIYLVPGKGGIFGNVDGKRAVYSQQHKGVYAHAPEAGDINKNLDSATHHALPSLGKYKTLSYGQLEAMAPSSKLNTETGALEDIDGSLYGTTAQFGNTINIDPTKYSTGYGRIKGTGTIEGRYKFGSPGMPDKDRTDPLGGVNAGAGPNFRYDTLDLLGVQGYIPPSNAGTGLVDGTPLNIDKLKPLSGDYPDLIPLQFYDITHSSWIIFRAYIGKFNDTISPSWGSTDIAGRSQPMYYYQKTERKVSFDFKVAATSKHELAPMWQKLNYLVGLCYPSFNGDTYPTMVNPFIKLTLGDVFHHVPGFLSTLTISPIDNIPWEIVDDPKRGLARVPMGMNVSLDFTYVGDALGTQRSPNHYLQQTPWVDYTNSYWQKGGAYPKNIQEPLSINEETE